MTNLRRLSVALIAVLGLAAVSSAQISADLTLASHYGFRGADVLGGAKLPVQPSVTWEHDSGISANVWGSFAVIDRDIIADNTDELDVTVNYSRPLNDQFGLCVGAIMYYWPSSDILDPSLEGFVGVSAADMPFSPRVMFFYDTSILDDFDAMYFNIAASHSVPVADYSLDLGLSIGYNPDTAYDLGLTASLPIEMGGMTLTPFGTFTYAADDVNPDNTVIFGGLTVSRAF